MKTQYLAETPNPSIEGTSTIRLRLLAAAPHVKRSAARRDEEQHMTELEGLGILFVGLTRKPRGA